MHFFYYVAIHLHHKIMSYAIVGSWTNFSGIKDLKQYSLIIITVVIIRCTMNNYCSYHYYVFLHCACIMLTFILHTNNDVITSLY